MSGPAAADTGRPTAPRAHVTVRRAQVKTELSMAYAQEFYSTVRDKCFNKCVTRPSTSLSSGEQACLARCCDRYVEATGVVSKAMLQAGKGME